MNNKKPYNNNNNRGENKQGRPAKKPQRIRITVEEGQISFRLLCPVSFAGGLIGHSGTIVKNLEIETSGKIFVEDALAADSAERLIYVLGSEAVDKAVRFRNAREGESGDVFEVSVGQEALLRVYERILEVETSAVKLDADANAGGRGSGGDSVVRCCRLLAVTDQIGALMGREGKRINKIRKESGAFIRVLSLDQLPPLANPADELIQITGSSIAVRKALVAVSKCLQENPPKEKASAFLTTPSVTSSYWALKHPPVPSYPRSESSSTPFTGNMIKPPSVPYPSFADGVSYGNMDGFRTVEVVYKMLCSSDTAGSIIGKGGSLVKTLQEETGASIYFSGSLPGCHERAISISAMENAESPQSLAQDAVLRVFARAIEALTKNGLVSKRNNEEVVTARLVIPFNQAGCLIGVRGTIVSDLQKVTGTRIQVLEGNQVPRCVTNDERVVQIAGAYANVQNALVEITRKLRERMLSSKGINALQTKSSSPYPVPNFVPPGRVNDGAIPKFSRASNIASSRNGLHTLEHKLENLNLSQDVNGLHTRQNFTGQASVTTSTGRAKFVSGESSAATVTNMTVEVVVPQNIFSSVFNDDGEKLARLKEISGAQIDVQHPSPGNEGKVIITGTPNQTLSGRSILQLYIVSAKV
ncbi:hypothetical protein V2J09_016415 [Rumex salicifolius]